MIELLLSVRFKSVGAPSYPQNLGGTLFLNPVFVFLKTCFQ